MEEKKKSGLQKDISSIFAGLENIDNGREDKSAPPPEPRAPSPEPPVPPTEEVPPIPFGREEEKSKSAPGPAELPPIPSVPQTPASLVWGGNFPKRRNAFLGLDVGASSIKIIQIYPVSGGWEMGGYAVQEFKTSSGGRNLFETEIIARNLKEFFSTIGASRSGVICSLRGERINTSLIQLARMPKGELESACRLEVSRRVTFNIDKALTQHIAVSEEGERPGAKLNHLVTAVSRETVSRILGVLRQAGLQVAALFPLPFAWKEFLQSVIGCDEGTAVAVVDVGSTWTLVSIYRGDRLHFSREFDTGGRQITEAIIQAATTFGAQGKMSWDEAEKIKRTTDLFQTDGAHALKSNLTVSQVGSMVRPVLEKIVQETKRSLDYYQQLYRKEEVNRVYLCGGSALLPGFEQFFKERMRSPVELLRLSDRVKLHSSIASEEEARSVFPRLARAAALSISRRWEVNFIPPIDKVLQNILRRKILILIPVLALFVVSFLFYKTEAALIPQQKKIIAGQAKQLGRLQVDLEPYKVLSELEKQLTAREKVGLYSTLRQPNWKGILKEFSRITPPTMVLTEIITLEGEGPRRILLSGQVLNPELSLHAGVTQFIVQVENSPFFREVEKISEDIDKGTFSFSCTLIY